MEEIYTISQAAKLLQVHDLTIRRYIKEGRLPAIRIGGNVRVTAVAIKNFTHSFIPVQRQDTKEQLAQAHIFTLGDAFLRLKGKGISMNKLT